MPISVRVTDAVGHQTTTAFSLVIDSVSPVSTVNLGAGDTRRVLRNAQNAWTLPLSGTATDALAGLDSVTLQIGAGGNVSVPASAFDANGNWTFAYPFDDIAFNASPNPTDAYTLTVTATDSALPDGNPLVLQIPFVIDMTPPVVELLSQRDEDFLTGGDIVTGTVGDANGSISSVEYAFVAADTVFATERTLLNLPLNDLPQSVLFANLSNEATRIFCLDESCPTSGIAGNDGTAAGFDGNDLLRNFDLLPTLPAAGTTTALWFKTTCADCGLFSLLQGRYPDQTQHDRDLFLSAGSVCARVTTGGTPDLRCTPANDYADGQWHHVVHTLGSNGHNLYLDGALAVSSPQSSGFGSLDAVAVGYSAVAGTPFLTGTLDDVVVYAADLSTAAAVALYRPWQPATLNPDDTWSFSVPEGLEGYYQIDMRAADSAGNRIESRGDWPQYRGPIDSARPTFEVSATYSGSGSAAQTRYAAGVRDRNLTTDDYSFVCPLINDDLVYATDPAFLAFAGGDARQTLAAIEAACLRAGFQTSLVSAYACDSYGHCGAAQPPQIVAYIGTTANTLNPFGSLPNAIERTNLSDPANRVRLIERPGRTILDIEVDQVHGKLYWAEGTPGAGQPFAGEIWRANLDGSSPQRLFSGLLANLPDLLQIALDIPGNKLYWTAGYQLFWANLDGTQAGPVYSVPDDPRVGVGGLREYHGIGDVVVDAVNRKLYISERRNRMSGSNALSPHSLIVEMGLAGQNPAFVAGVRDGCTYQNWNDNLGTGVGLGQKPDTCLAPNGGIDVESLAVADGTLYWSAYASVSSLLQLIDGGGLTPLSGPQEPAVWGKRPGEAAFQVAALPGLSANQLGINTGPVPHLYVNPISGGVFAQYGTQIVRAEAGGEFTIFTNFRDETPPVVGTTTRRSSTLSALAVVEVPGDVVTQADLRVELKSRDLLLVDGESGSIDVTLRNTSPLPAPDTTLTLTLPADVTFAGANRTCTAGGDVVTCDLGTLAPFGTQTAAISFTVSTADVRTLTFAASVGSSASEATPADNSATFANITAAPTVSALPGAPYLYYMLDTTQMVRVPLFGDYTPQPMRFDGYSSTIYSGLNLALAAAGDGQTLYFFDATPQLRAIDTQGGSGQVLADVYPSNTAGSGLGRNLSVAADPTTGDLFYTEQVSFFWSRLRRSAADGSNAQTINERVLLARSLVVDPLRRALYWIGSDNELARDLIYRSNLDGSNVEAVYASPAGRPLRDLALDPYTQTLYWLDPAYEGGAVLSADTQGGQGAIISTGQGGGVRGLVVLPANDAIYYVAEWGALYRNTLAGDDEQEVAWLGATTINAVSNLNPAELYRARIGPPTGNLVFAIGDPFPPSACATADAREPNNSAASASAITPGSLNAALCRDDLAQPADVDYFSVSVPPNKQLDVTLRDMPADYNLQIRQGDGVLAVSTQGGTANDSAAAANYRATAQTYTIVVYGALATNSVTPYTLDVSLSDAPPRTSFTNDDCQAVDPHEATPQTGNGSQGSATPLTLGTVITGALCFQFDNDFYSFSGTAGQTVIAQLLSYPTATQYSVHYYRPDGSFFNAFSAANSTTPVRLDAGGTWAVVVRQHPAQATLEPYTLLVRDATCGINDANEPNDTPARARAIDATRRLSATLCNASDVDYYALTATAGQQLTLDYPANAGGGDLLVSSADGTSIGRVRPGAQATFTLPTAGSYLLAVGNSALSGSDAPYHLQWQLDAPAPAATPFVTWFAGSVVRVALDATNAAEVLEVGNAVSQNVVAFAPQAGKLYFADSETLVSFNADGTGRSDVLDLNPNNAIGQVYPDLVAVDEPGGYLFYMTRFTGVNPTSYELRRADLDGSNSVVIAASVQDPAGLTVDPLSGLVYWADGNGLYRSRADGSGRTTLRHGAQSVRDLQIEPYTGQLYWVDPSAGTLLRWTPGSAAAPTVVIDSGAGQVGRGVALRPAHNELYFTRGDSLLRATLDGQNVVPIAELERFWTGPDNQIPGQPVTRYLGAPTSNLVIANGTPLLDACGVADGNEPNNDAAAATATTVTATTTIDAALCYSTLGWTIPDQDYYAVEVAPGKILSATLTNLPADYRLVIIHPDNYAAAFSDNAGLADEFGSVRNTSAAPQTYHVVVLTGAINLSNRPYRLTLELGDVPPPPPALPPDDQACALVDPFDAPAPGGNGTPATATPLTFDTAVPAALCYVDDVDVYSFDGLAGQTLTFDLPTRPADYTLTLRDPVGAPSAVAYGDSVTLPSAGTWTIEVAHAGLTPTTEQYALLVSDTHCVASDANEPNNTLPTATALGADGRAHASLCAGADIDLYTFNATAGAQWTLNYPAGTTGAALRVYPAGGGGDVAGATSGTQTTFTTPAAGSYVIEVANAALTQRDARYLFQLRAGAPPAAPAGSPFLYSSNVGFLTRAGVGGTVEPLLLDNGGAGGHALAADTQRNVLFIRTFDEQIARVDPDGRNYTVIADADPIDRWRLPSTLAVDEQSGQIYWSQPTGGLLSKIMRADADGSNVFEIVPQVVREQALAVDPVAGHLYWVEDIFWNNAIRNVIGRSDLDGGNPQMFYAAPDGREIRDLAIDPFGRKLYWIDPTQQSIVTLDADGSDPTVLLTLDAPGRGLVVLPLADTGNGRLYFSAGDSIRRADLDGGNVQEVARQSGQYTGVSNLDAGVFFPTTLGAPQTNLVLAFGAPLGAPCATVDALEPNNSAETAAAITPGSLTAALCTNDLNNNDSADYYKLTVQDGEQISVTLRNVPQDYALLMSAPAGGSEWSYNPGLADEFVTHINRSGAPFDYLILVSRFAGMDSRLPYTLDVVVTTAPPPPPPPPPPADVCLDVDPYDAPGYDGNWNRDNATPIAYNTPITAALCYAPDADYYSWDGELGQNVTISLDPRPADYYVALYGPDGQYVTGIFPGSWLTYGDAYVLNATGRWTLAVWYPQSAGTTEQYTLELSFNSDCFGNDPYEPNNEQFGGTTIVTPTMTLRGVLCKAGTPFGSDADWFEIPVQVGDRLRLTPRALADGVSISASLPGTGFFELTEPLDRVINSDGEVQLGIYVFGGQVEDNLPYVIDLRVDPPPVPWRPNNWSCTTYDSGALNLFIDDLTTLDSPPLTLPISGTLTYVALSDLTWTHNYPNDLTFGLRAPDGTAVELFNIGDYVSYNWCGDDQCQLSLADDAQAGLYPPFPVVGGPYRPSRGNFSTFNGLSPQGDWTLLLADNGPSIPDDEVLSDTTGTLFGWELEVCVDNGLPPGTPPVTDTPDEPTPGDDSTPGGGTPDAPPDAATSCVAPAADPYEPNDTPATAVTLQALVSISHTLHTAGDLDWFQVDLTAGHTYTFTVVDVGGGTRAGLLLFAADGSTRVGMTTGDPLSVTPLTTGRHYVRVSWNGGMGVPCGAAYSLTTEVFDPTAPPPPAESSGSPLPPDHVAPLLSAGVLEPQDRSVLAGTRAASVPVQVGLSAEGEIKAAALYANAQLVDTYSATRRAPEYDVLWTTNWTPTTPGAYLLHVVITDTNDITATSPAGTVYVDAAGPAVTLVTETVTQAQLQADGSYLLGGTASDDAQVARVDVRLNGGDWQPAQLSGNNWTLAISPPALPDPDGGSVTVEVRATDVADNTATESGSFIVDVVAPAAFALATSLTNGTPITPTLPTGGLQARLTWPALADADTLVVGWSSSAVANPATLGTAAVGGGSRDNTQGEASIRYAHAVATDARGNQTVVTRGPFYFDTPATSDLIGDLAFDNWPLSGGKQVGSAPGTPYGDQALFAGWNAFDLRLRWQGVNVANDIDLIFYLATAGSGTSDALAAGAPTLPFAADYAVRVSDGDTATFYRVVGGSWVADGAAVITTTATTVDVLLAWADLGIATPATSDLRLLAVAAEDGSGAIWATIPDKNVGQATWNQYIEWPALGSGVVPAAGVWADAQIAARLTAQPDPLLPLGAGDAITLTVVISNGGSAPLPALTLDGSTTGGVTLADAPQAAANLAAGAGVTLTLHGTATLSGTVDLTLEDSYHRPYALETLAYVVDVAPPISLTFAISHIGLLTNTIETNAQDLSSIAQFEVEIDGPTRAPVNVVCSPAAAPGSFVCLWNAGTVTDGQTFQLRAQATDVHGNTSAWSSPVGVPTDVTPPVLTLSAATQAALADGRLGLAEQTLTGTLTDLAGSNPGLPVAVQLCVDSPALPCVTALVAADGSWSLNVPADGDEYAATLTFIGTDAANNDSAPLVVSTYIDRRPPTFGATTVTRLLVADGDPQAFASGTVTDGDALASVVALLVPPSVTPVISTTATVNRAGWSVAATFVQEGAYQVLFVATDAAGNTRTQFGGTIVVDADPTAVTLGGARAEDLSNLWLPLLLVAGLAWVSWRLVRRVGGRV